jgi:hypothetical protein
VKPVGQLKRILYEYSRLRRNHEAACGSLLADLGEKISLQQQRSAEEAALIERFHRTASRYPTAVRELAHLQSLDEGCLLFEVYELLADDVPVWRSFLAAEFDRLVASYRSAEDSATRRAVLESLGGMTFAIDDIASGLWLDLRPRILRLSEDDSARGHWLTVVLLDDLAPDRDASVLEDLRARADHPNWRVRTSARHRLNLRQGRPPRAGFSAMDRIRTLAGIPDSSWDAF